MRPKLKLVKTKSFEDTEEFKELQAKWYNKLKEKGFEDIEDTKGNLKRWGHTVSLLDNPDAHKVWRDSQVEYYRLANQYLFDKTFPSAVWKLIWKLHAQGMTFKAIAGRTGMSRSNVQYRIERMRDKFFPRD